MSLAQTTPPYQGKVRYDSPILALNLQTTGLDAQACGIVQYGMALQTHPDKEVRLTVEMVNPPEEIEAGATEVHGIDRAKAQGEGMDVRAAMERIGKALGWAEEHHALIVGHNMQFVWTVLTGNANRHSKAPVPHPYRFVQTSALYDTLVVSRQVEPERKGGHGLRTLAREYDLFDMLVGANGEGGDTDAGVNAELALHLAREQIGAGFLDLEEVPYVELTRHMQAWHAGWADEHGPALPREWPNVPPTA